MATKRTERLFQSITSKENVVQGKSNVTAQQPQKRLILEDIKNKVCTNIQRKPTIKQDALAEKVPVKLRKIPREKSQDVKPEATVSSVPMEVNTSIDKLTDAFSSRLLPLNVEDIDADDAKNPQLVSEYINDIYQYLRELEVKFRVKAQFLCRQTEITGRMRGVLIDWLVQVHLRFKLLQETLYLTVDIVDRFLQECDVKRSKLQLVGVTAMFVASKYEEMYSPAISDFVYITDKAYTKQEILKMECLMLSVLKFSLGRPLPLHFLRRNSKAGNVDNAMHNLAKYLMELTLVEYDLAHFLPSHVAAAALCLSMKILDNSPWNKTLVYYSQYEESKLFSLMCRMCHMLCTAEKNKLKAVYTKYTSSKFLKVSTIPELKCKIVQDFAEKYTSSESNS